MVLGGVQRGGRHFLSIIHTPRLFSGADLSAPLLAFAQPELSNERNGWSDSISSSCRPQVAGTHTTTALECRNRHAECKSGNPSINGEKCHNAWSLDHHRSLSHTSRRAEQTHNWIHQRSTLLTGPTWPAISSSGRSIASFSDVARSSNRDASSLSTSTNASRVNTDTASQISTSTTPSSSSSSSSSNGTSSKLRRVYARARGIPAADGGGGFVVTLEPWESQGHSKEARDAKESALKETGVEGRGPAGGTGDRSGGDSKGGDGGQDLHLHLLKTPAKQLIRLPTEALAVALAAEWEYQESLRFKPYTMPLMKFVCTAIDQLPSDRDRVILHLLHFLHTDCILCRDDPQDPSHSPAHGSLSLTVAASNDGRPTLQEVQAREWDPILEWVEQQYGVRPVASAALVPPNQPDKVIRALFRALNAMDNFQLAAIDSLAGAARSLLLALATARGHLGADVALKAMRVEEDYQIDRWGFVEGGHDIDTSDLKVRVMAASVFLRLLEVK